MMDASSFLEELRSDFPACLAIGFADLSSGLMLATSAVSEQPQEWWNDLCQCAAKTLDAPIAAEDEVEHAVLFDPFEQKLFIRSAGNRADALCCIASPDLPLAPFIRDAETTLARIEEESER